MERSLPQIHPWFSRAIFVANRNADRVESRAMNVSDSSSLHYPFATSSDPCAESMCVPTPVTSINSSERTLRKQS